MSLTFENHFWGTPPDPDSNPGPTCYLDVWMCHFNFSNKVRKFWIWAVNYQVKTAKQVGIKI
jgi:hypothetical protein